MKTKDSQTDPSLDTLTPKIELRTLLKELDTCMNDASAYTQQQLAA